MEWTDAMKFYLLTYFYVTSLYKFLSIVFLHQSHFIFLFLYYFIYCNRLFYSHLAFPAPDEDYFCLVEILGK